MAADRPERETKNNRDQMKSSFMTKLALITGASSGIGAATAELLSTKGFSVILVARRVEKLTSIALKIKESGGTAYVYPSDLKSSANRELLVKNITSEIGTPDILINNAGIGWYGYFSQMPWTVIDELLALNIESVTHLTSLLLPKMIGLGSGRVINVGSIAGKLPEQGVSVYSASKAYLDAFTTSVYRELRGSKVTISVLRAGPVRTEFFDRASKQPGGGQIPAERFAVSPTLVANSIWKLIKSPKRFSYVPRYLALSPLLELAFSWAIDLVGPLLLRKKRPA